MSIFGRDIRTLSLTFTAGVALGTLFPPPTRFSACAAAMLVLPAMIFSVMLLLRRGSSFAGRAIPIVYLAAGAFSALSAGIGSLGPGGLTLVERWTAGIAENVRELIDSIPFPGEGTAPLLKALVTGDRTGLSGDTVASFRRSGASHILALSGLHIGIIHLLLRRLTIPIGNSRTAKTVRYFLTVSAALLFTLSVGAGPSVTRAFLFILLNETGAVTGRRTEPAGVLCAALLIQLALAPMSIKNLGFQLSYLAMAGIFLIHPHLSALYPDSSKWDPLRRIWTAVSLTLSCQVTTAPLVWLRFHTFPRWFILTNLLALPLTTALMSAGIACMALSAVGLCPDALILATDFLCGLLEWILGVISSM